MTATSFMIGKGGIRSINYDKSIEKTLKSDFTLTHAHSTTNDDDGGTTVWKNEKITQKFRESNVFT